MANYPGSQILFEVGTRSELANIYGVSERTIYRWLNKASAESGLSPKVKKKAHPRPETLANFKGTRKQLAKKYGVSERTAYRWLNKARQGGSLIPSRAKNNYPGADVINNLLATVPLTNKQIADQYGVSERTAARWIRKARQDNPALLPDLRKTGEYKLTRKGGYSRYERVTQEEPFTIPEPSPEFDIPDEQPFEEPDYSLPPEDEIPEDFDDFADFDISEEMFGNLKGINEVVLSNDLTDSDIFRGLTYKEKILYLNNYLMYQYDQDRSQFYDRATHRFRFDTEWVTQYVDIWGDEFDNWVERQFESDMYEI